MKFDSEDKSGTDFGAVTPEFESAMENSSLYQEFLAEREEIQKHKWLESEKVGYDIGFERALLSWVRKHRDKWLAGRRKAI